ncbi:MAG: hypothetical protein A2629_01970 [Candidatus Levybacteria bacterium RIFCSPHIGHO2_01_FULL_41_15]|nr:MAG: hypothetical protein A2629_01970 [Candidatus Levybacteria bacterium RIFCSPHIGHO2_01_FULL_41_15]
MKLPKIKPKTLKKITKIGKITFWFSVGAFIGLFLFVSFTFVIFQTLHKDVIYPGIMVNGIDFGGKKEADVENYFLKKNEKIKDTKFTFISSEEVATISAKELNLGYNGKLLGKQAFSIGRSGSTITNISIVFQAFLYGVNLPASYRYSEEKLLIFLSPVIEAVKKDPIDSLFTFTNGRVTEFKPSRQGQKVDIEELKGQINSKILSVVNSQKPQEITINIPIKVIEPKITTEKANNLGISELVGQGSSLFQGSIQGRIHNITLAAARLNGLLVAPSETFSFNKALGDVSAFTGYQQAYIIKDGKTILGDGGGVCQVSTTLFRAILNAGLPVIERNPHSYRVGYYEQDSPPGLDATVYAPSVDLKFKNDTENYILIQAFVNPNILGLTFELYGTKDTRVVTLGKPVITSRTPAPADLYQDDPTLAKGQIKQVDFSAPGAQVYFTRQVVKDGKTIISDKFSSSYRPWQAVFLRGTKEN